MNFTLNQLVYFGPKDQFPEKECKIDGSNIEWQIVDDKQALLNLIEESSSALRMIFIDPNHYQGNPAEILAHAHLHQPGIPVIFLGDNLDQLFSKVDPEKLGLLRGPLIYSELPQFIKDTVVNLELDFKQTPESEKLRKEGSGLIKTNERTLTPIRSYNLLQWDKALYDFFIKLRDGHSVKIFRKGEALDRNRINLYIAKGLQHFYIPTEQLEEYIKKCQALATTKIKSLKPTEARKFILSHGEDVLRFFSNTNISKESIDLAVTYSSQAYETIKDFKSNDSQVQILLEDVVSHHHAASTVLVSSILAKEYGLMNQECVEIIGVGAFLHDIGLYLLKPYYAHDESFLLYDEELIEFELTSDSCPTSRKRELLPLYHQHPIEGAKIIQKIKGVNPLVGQIVYQHHMRQDGSGFPDLIKGQVISPHAQIVGIADEFCKTIRLIAMRKLPPKAFKNFTLNLPKFSTKLYRVFWKVFLENEIKF